MYRFFEKYMFWKLEGENPIEISARESSVISVAPCVQCNAMITSRVYLVTKTALLATLRFCVEQYSSEKF